MKYSFPFPLIKLPFAGKMTQSFGLIYDRLSLSQRESSTHLFVHLQNLIALIRRQTVQINGIAMLVGEHGVAVLSTNDISYTLYI